MSRSSALRLRRVAVALLALLLLPVGVAQLAVNAVPVTRAGLVEAEISLPTALRTGEAKVNLSQEAGKQYYKFQQLRATLVRHGQAISGAAVTFTVNGHEVCSATTKANGVAKCDNGAKFDVGLFGAAGVPTSYTASFPGMGALEPSSATGVLRPIGDGSAGESRSVESSDAVE